MKEMIGMNKETQTTEVVTKKDCNVEELMKTANENYQKVLWHVIHITMKTTRVQLLYMD